MKLTNCQKEAVEKILQKYNSGVRRVDFKAPTGAGKTFIISHLISEIFLQKASHEKIIVLLATISSAELPKQFADKVEKYQKFFPFSYKVEHKKSPSSQKRKSKDYEVSLLAEDQKLIIVGRSSFTKASIFIERGIFDKFLDQVKNENYKLIYIRDEAHYGGLIDKPPPLEKKDQKFEKIIQDTADFVLRMTATMHPTHEQVVITEDEVNSNGQYLLKEDLCSNCGLSSSPNTYIDKIEFLRKAITKFKEIKNEYKKLQQLNESPAHINPAILIQVDSKTELNSATFKQDVENIITELKQANLSWVQYFENDKKSSTMENISLLKLSENSSSIDAIIFKIGPATGWDIPRACMLIQLRHVNSTNLNQQTLGRIKRNPMPRLVFNDITNKYYLYSRYQEFPIKMDHYVLKKEYENVKWIQGNVEIGAKNENLVLSKYCENITNFFTKKMYSIKQQIEKEFKKDYLLYKPLDIKVDGFIKKHAANEIHNAIKLKIFLQEKKSTNKKLFDPIIKLINQITSENKIDLQDQFYFILIKYYMEDLNNSFRKSYEVNSRPQYSIKEIAFLPKNYTLWKSDDYNASFKKVKEIYAYTNGDNTKLWNQVLDSFSECSFMDEVVESIADSYVNKELWGRKIQVWTKNSILFSNIFLQYLDEQSMSKKMFVDFIFKVNNGYIYVEVKSASRDYDLKKTKNIAKAFECYAKVSNKNIVFSIVKVTTKKDNYSRYEYENYSQIPEIKKNFTIEKVIKCLAKRTD